MNCIGFDAQGNKLQLGDICEFKFKNKDLEGIIIYDESSYAFAFEMKDDNFPMLLMKNANFDSIKKIINVTETKLDDEYEFYRRIYNTI